MPLAIIAEDEVIGAPLSQPFVERFAHAKLRRLHPRIHPRIRDLVGKDIDELIMPTTNCALLFLAETLRKTVERDDLEIVSFGGLHKPPTIFVARVFCSTIEDENIFVVGRISGHMLWDLDGADCGQEARFVLVREKPSFPLIYLLLCAQKS
ncbi:hypothetical protein NLM27_39830 [Bradyrhizobium sp. CCGB12]|uniref:hypothetical protein n=1 Tax=Bradyrhizobium sp. CCGB12 TaxID=2949632 RepID=UPI0020B2A469|nr:hypothetical protein [Bradyrhizobium sp. CCGB12]MCP3394905.1 hypothetical protein [Bradyrhizobium sp. CCGB12]